MSSLLSLGRWDLYPSSVQCRKILGEVAALKMPDIIAKMKLQGLHPLSSTPAEFASLLVSEVDHWAKVIPSIGIQPE